ncbi:uncharacterized protein LOC108676977, partial [Hyalella azteca]|uniref:Uncharacterized protein LOC108676977 n=1 Tax=Hyalella azteca TaxID=294128 RepID=A0A8B7P3I8_HYAAZ
MHCLGIAQSLNWSVASCFSAAREGSQWKRTSCSTPFKETVVGCIYVNTATVDWTTARQQCTALGSDLYTADTHEQYEAMRMYFLSTSSATCTGPTGQIVQVGQTFNTDSGPSYLCTDDGPEIFGKRSSCSTPFVETAVGCIYVNTATVDWTTARQQCTALGADLFTADTHEQYEAMRMYILSTSSAPAEIWVAIKKVGNTWMWSPSGRSPGPNYKGDWAYTDPNGAQFNQQCARMTKHLSYFLADTGCESLYS